MTPLSALLLPPPPFPGVSCSQPGEDNEANKVDFLIYRDGGSCEQHGDLFPATQQVSMDLDGDPNPYVSTSI